MNKEQAAITVQNKLNAMSHLELGSMLHECNKLISDPDRITRMTAEILKSQVLAAFAHKADVDMARGTFVYPPEGQRLM